MCNSNLYIQSMQIVSHMLDLSSSANYDDLANLIHLTDKLHKHLLSVIKEENPLDTIKIDTIQADKTVEMNEYEVTDQQEKVFQCICTAYREKYGSIDETRLKTAIIKMFGRLPVKFGSTELVLNRIPYSEVEYVK